MKMNFARTTAQVALRFPDHEALVNTERGRRYTVSEIDRLTNRMVHMMRERLGLRRGDRYLCLLENDNLSLLHTWMILKGEAAAVWTNYRDSFDEHMWQVDWVEPKVVFLENALLERYHAPLRERGIMLVCMDPLETTLDGVRYFWELMEGMPDSNPGIESDTTTDILSYRFTGGTTGRGKCAQYTMDNWLACRDAFYADADSPFDDKTRSLQIAPLSHGAALGILPVFFRGGCLVTHNVPDLGAWCRTVEAERITMSSLVPTILYRLLELEEARRHDLSTLQTIYYGAAPMSPSKLSLLQERFGNIFMQIYGSTECLQPVARLSKPDHLGNPAHLAAAGRVASGAEVVVMDENGSEVLDGTVGEVWLRTRSTISGYYRNPEGTAAEFCNGFWKSGDLGYRDAEGFLYIVDRKKDMIITGGFNVYAIEVEAALNAHPAILMSVAVGVPHELWGEAIHAEVIAKPGSTVTADEIIEFVKAKIGKHKAPKSVDFVSELPLSAAHKVLRRKVRDKHWAGQARLVG